ncbi:hypothetical protein RBI13_13235 [Alcaligenaceae bacterium A4P071]|nr:hypothetical protein [Alcaligenaceae bacterium A4P071]
MAKTVHTDLLLRSPLPTISPPLLVVATAAKGDMTREKNETLVKKQIGLRQLRHGYNPGETETRVTRNE